MLKNIPQPYIRLFKTETPTSIIFYAVCIKETSPGEYVLSEPKVVKIIDKNVLTLPGRIQNIFALPGATLRGGYVEHHIVSPYYQEYKFKTTDFLKWYFSNAPNSIA